MRSFLRHGLVVASCFGAVVASGGCSAKKATEYVTGMSTQMQVPRDVKAIRVSVSINGVQQFCQGYAVDNGVAYLPKSLGNFPRTDDAINSGAVRWEIAAISAEEDNGDDFYTACDEVAKVGDEHQVRLLRSSTQPYIQDRILYLAMPLKYSCYDVDCSSKPGTTCKGGQCVDENLTKEQAEALPDFVEGQGDGSDASCFSTGLCMGTALPAIPVDPTTCTFVLPETKDAPSLSSGTADPFRPACTKDEDCNGGTLPANANLTRKCGVVTAGICDLLPAAAPGWSGLNVQVTYDGARTNEILDLDAVEGFTIPDPTKPQTFKLAPGLCSMWKGDAGTTHRITSVRASGSCGPKTPTQPICKADALALQGLNPDGTVQTSTSGVCNTTQLSPTPAALMLVLDNTTGNSAFFSDPTVITNFKVPLADPAFANTQFGLMFAPDTLANQCVDSRQPAVALEPDVQGSNDIQAKLTALATGSPADLVDTPDPSFGNALTATYGYLNANVPNLIRRGVLLLGNRDFDTQACTNDGVPHTLAAQAFAQTNPIQTFVLELTKDGQDATTNGGAVVAGAGYLTNGQTVIDYDLQPTTDEAKQNSFEKIIDHLTTCAYDVPTTIPTDASGNPEFDKTSSLTYADPLTQQQTTIPFNAGCTSDNDIDDTHNGWGFDATSKHIFVCGSACSTYRTVHQQAAVFALVYGQAALSLPMYWSSQGCATTATASK